MLERSFKRFLKNKLGMAGFVLLVIVTIIASLGPYLVQDSYNQDAKAFLGPSFNHLMGTDYLGRDILSRVVTGARYSLTIGVISVFLAFIFGLMMGSFAGFYGGILDIVIMRLVDIFLAFPFILGAIALMVVIGPGIYNVPIAIAIFSWAAFARMYRSSVLEIKEKEYVLAARSLGAGSFRIMFKHIMPNAIPSLIIFAATDIAYAILGETVLSFVGLGVPAPFPSWGRMLSDSMNFMPSSFWQILFPGLFLIITVLAFILIGDNLRDAFDPGSR